MGQTFGIVPRRGFFPHIDNPVFSHNPNVGFPYGWNWTSGASVASQIAGPSYFGFAHNLGGFNPLGGLPMGGSVVLFNQHLWGQVLILKRKGESTFPFKNPLRTWTNAYSFQPKCPNGTHGESVPNGRIYIFSSTLS